MSNVSTRNITFRCVLALGLIALLSISGYVILYGMAASREDTAVVINISGSQRWLSQRAAAYSLRLVTSHNKTERERFRQELLQISNRMKDNQDWLIHGNSSMRLSGSPSPQIRAMYFDPPLLLDKQIHNYIEEIHALIYDTDDKLTRNNPHLRYILSASASKLIQSLDAVVKQYQAEFEANSKGLRKMGIGVMGFILFVLFMVALFIFRPMISRIRRDTAKLAQSETHLRSIVDNAMDGIITVDAYGVIESFNAASEKMLGYTSDEVNGRNIRMLIPEFYYGYLYDYLWTDKERTSYLKTYETKAKRKDGTSFSMDTSLGEMYLNKQRQFVIIIRDVTERVQVERRSNAEHAVTHILAESDTLNEASQEILQAICECLEWDLGKIWLIDRKAGVLRCEEIWHIPSLEATEFTAVTRQDTFSSGVGLLGRVWASAKPAWIADVVHDANFPRAPVAAKAGLHAAFAFPILIGNDVVGIIDFFSHEIREPNERILNMMSAIGSQIGQFIRRKEAESQIVKLSRAVEQSPNTILITDVKGNIEYVNPKGVQLTGYIPEEIIGKNSRIFKSGETSPEEYKRLWAIITSGGEWRGEFLNKKKNGECYWEHASISPIKDSSGVITNFIAIKEDITERKKFEIKLEYMANNDPLTNLFNRRRFREELEGWIARAERYGSRGALLFLDLDNFKYINDTLGHQKGDEILINFACLLRQRVRETDVLARLGGDEFAIILPFTNAYRAQSIAMQILGLATGNTNENNGGLPSVTASVGIALFPEHGDDTEKLIASADIAMYRAKEKGRNCVCMYSPDQKIRYESRLDWDNRIRDALNNNRFVLYLQPISNVRHKKIMGYEALLRMVACPQQGSKNENDTLISPRDFLNIAERIGLIREIDRWVARRAIRLIAEQQFADRGLFLGVNLSGRVFNDPELLPLIKQEFAATNMNPESIVFEITETAAIENMADAQRFIIALKSIGCRFSLDDFGIGFSSFSYLKQLPVDYLKIDGSFITQLKQNQTDQHLVRAIVEIARGLGKQTIAEFVECEETMQLLSEYGVDYAQGYHIGKPCAVSEIDTVHPTAENAEVAEVMIEDKLEIMQ